MISFLSKEPKTNNLKNLSLKLSKYQVTVVTGVSGSGKSSLVFDTLAPNPNDY